MAKMTLLEMVQKVLVSVNGDEVESISDTVESLMIANMIEDVFNNMVSNRVVPEHKELIKVDALGNGDMPNYLKLPTNVINITSFRYNKTDDYDNETEYVTVKYVDPEVFLERVSARDQTDSNIDVVVDFSGVRLLIQNDKQPDYWTSFDDLHMVFDSYDSDVENTLQSTKSLAYGTVEPTFTLSDDFTPDIDSNMFTLLLNEAKAWAHLELKQQTHGKAEQQARKQRTLSLDEKDRFKKGGSYPDYGR